MSDYLDEDAFFGGLEALLEVVTATGFEADLGHHQPTWIRTRRSGPGGEDGDVIGEKVVLWRHPRYPDELHGHVATSASPHAVHLRFFDPEWCPERVLPGYLEKGFEFDDLVELGGVAEKLKRVIWPRALAWFRHPVPADELLSARGSVLALVKPGPVLEQHRRRAEWLDARGQSQEAEYVRGVIAEIEAMCATHTDDG